MNPTNFSIGQSALFQELRAELESLTPEQINNTLPGNPLPPGAQIVGVMSDTARGLLTLYRLAKANEARALVDLYDPRPKDERTVRTTLGEAQQRLERARKLFFLELEAFITANSDISHCGQLEVGFGPHFEFYWRPV